ncbi:hypothetical protein [Microcoleus sp. N3A4]|uniref:hypothetical protein n=1 Tax=Microcoleus sp. N3A4 TaxID=3055379 RepID=UPI002FD33F36
MTLSTPTAPVRCCQLRLDVSREQGSYEAVQVLSVDLRFETSALDFGETLGDRSSRAQSNNLRFTPQMNLGA